jgi:prenyltransferase beta subunit
MNRIVAVALLIACSPVHAQQPDAKKQTVAYVRSLQTEDGGFRPAAKGPASLKATSAAVRALHYLGGEIPNRETAAKFVTKCFDAETGGFADAPGGKVDVFSTSVGLMAVVALEMSKDPYAAPAGKYLADHAKGFEDIRIAIAGFEAIESTPATSAKWVDDVIALQNGDGTFGKGAGQARDTGGAVVALMRLRLKFPNPGRILTALREGQRTDGGFGKADAPSDLESSYRIMRCFAMLKARPKNVDGLRSFLAKCRNDDGCYGVSPGQPSNVGGCYYAATIEHWLER